MPKSESRDYYESYEISRWSRDYCKIRNSYVNKPHKSRNSESNEQSPRNIFEIFSCSWAHENFSHSRGLRTDISPKTVVGCPWSFGSDLMFMCGWMFLGTIYDKAFHGFYSIWQIRKLLSMQSIKILVHAFVSSHLDYCNLLLFGLP